MAGLGLGGRSGWLRVGSMRGRATRARSTRARSTGVGLAALACASALTLSACNLRLETAPVTFPSPDATTVERNSLADAEAAVLAAATKAGASADDTASGAAATAQKHLDVLGGVYVAHPGTTPAPSVSPAPAPTLADAIHTVRAKAEDAAATTKDGGLAFLARSIDLDWALRELWATRVAAKSTADSAAAQASAQASASPSLSQSTTQPSATGPAPLPGDSGDTPFPHADGSASDTAGFAPSGTTTGLTEETLSNLTLAEDEARFAYETIAALEFGSLRESILARMRLHAQHSDALATVLTSQLHGADPRTPLYQLRDANLSDPDSRETLERSIEIDLGDRYAALLDGASAADAAWLLNATFGSYARAMATPGFAAADLPTLPGLRVGAARSSASPGPSGPATTSSSPTSTAG